MHRPPRGRGGRQKRPLRAAFALRVPLRCPGADSYSVVLTASSLPAMEPARIAGVYGCFSFALVRGAETIPRSAWFDGRRHRAEFLPNPLMEALALPIGVAPHVPRAGERSGGDPLFDGACGDAEDACDVLFGQKKRVFHVAPEVMLEQSIVVWYGIPLWQ